MNDSVNTAALNDVVDAIQVPRPSAHHPSSQQCPAVQHPQIQPEDHRRQHLDDPQAAQQLELQGVRHRHEDDEHQSADLHHQRRNLRDRGLLRVRRIGREEPSIDRAADNVGAGDRHDRRRHQRADRDGGKRHAGEPPGEDREDQRRYGEVVAVPLEPVGERGIVPTCSATAMKPSSASKPSTSE